MSEYPSEEDFKKIRHWDLTKNSPLEFATFICEIWDKHYGVARLSGKKVKTFTLWTGGFSVNEDIIKAIMETDFWTLYWERSIRGGFYVFKFI